MKNMKNFKKLSVLLLAALVSVSCIVDDENDNGFQSSIYTVGFAQKTATNSYFADEGVVTKEYPVNLLGGQSGTLPSGDITVNFAVNTALSTATEGVEFDLPLPGTLVLPQGSTFVQFPININTGSFDSETPTSVFIDLTSNQAGTQISDINKTIEIKFVGCLATIDQFSYSLRFDYTNLDGDLLQYNANDVHTFTGTGVPNSFLSDSTPPWGPNGLFTPLAPPADRNGYIMDVVCGDVFIVSQNLGNFYSNTVEGRAGSTNPAGYVDEITGDIHVTFDVCASGSCRKLDNVVYTRL